MSQVMAGRAEKKQVLRAAASQRLPGEILTKRKGGFEAPTGDWFRELAANVDPLRVLGTLSEHTDWLNWDFVEALFARERVGGSGRATLIMLLVFIDLWLRIFVVERGARPTYQWTAAF